MPTAKFDVIVWVRKTDVFRALREKLLHLAGGEPDESTAYEGMVDFHWRFAHLTAAEHLAAALSPLTSWPEVAVLRLANYDNLDASVTYKDDREFADTSPRIPMGGLDAVLAEPSPPQSKFSMLMARIASGRVTGAF